MQKWRPLKEHSQRSSGEFEKSYWTLDINLHPMTSSNLKHHELDFHRFTGMFPDNDKGTSHWGAHSPDTPRGGVDMSSLLAPSLLTCSETYRLKVVQLDSFERDTIVNRS